MYHPARYREPMTTTDLAGLPAEIAAALARAGLAQDAACDAAEIPRTSYYRRKATPGAWYLGELDRFLAVADVALGVQIGPLELDRDTSSPLPRMRLDELDAIARAADVTLRLVLERVSIDG